MRIPDVASLIRATLAEAAGAQAGDADVEAGAAKGGVMHYDFS